MDVTIRRYKNDEKVLHLIFNLNYQIDRSKNQMTNRNILLLVVEPSYFFFVVEPSNIFGGKA